MVTVNRPRRRSAIENDRRIVRAAVWCIDRYGVDGITTVGVAAAAGLSTGALYARYEHQHDLLVDVWLRESHDAVRDLVDAALEVSRSGGAPDSVAAFAQRLAEPSNALRIGVQLIAVARRVDELGDVVPGDLGAMLGDVGPDELGLVALAFGALLLEGVRGAARTDWAPVIGWFGTAPPATAILWPPAPALHATPALDPDDPLLDALVQATQRVIARSGVERTTLHRIGRAARVTPTVVYHRYESREDLIVDFVGRILRSTSTSELRTMVHSSPDMLALHLDTLLSVQGQPRRRLLLEVLLAASSNERLAAVVAGAEGTSFDVAAHRLIDRYGDTTTARGVLSFGAALAFGAGVLVELGNEFMVDDWRPLLERTLSAAATGLRAR